MKRGILPVLLLVAAVLLLSPRDPVRAATLKKDVIVNSEKTVKLDLDGDGQAERVRAKAHMKEYYIDKLCLYVNGKKAITVRDPLGWELGYSYWIDYVKLSSSQIYLRLRMTSDNDGVTTDALYQYDADKNRLSKVFDLLDWNLWGGSAEITKLTSKSMTIRYGFQSMYVGWGQFSAKYVVKGGILQLSKDTFGVKSTMGATGAKATAYQKLYAKNLFKARKKITFYKDPLKSGAKAFTVSKKQTVKLTKIRFRDNCILLQFKRGGKVGWIKMQEMDPETREVSGGELGEIFYDVRNHLAG